jgi:hypothetical protein
LTQMFRDEASYPDNAERSNFVFMGYPFEPPLPRDDYTTVVHELEATLPVRLWSFLDEITTDELMRKIWRAILRSDLAIFDVSGGNPNVAFELGLAVASGKRVITLLKTGEPNPLGRSDLAYAERLEYSSATTLKEKLADLLDRKSSALRLVDAVSYSVTPDDGSVARADIRERLTKLLLRVFTNKSVGRSSAATIMGSDALAVSALARLRERDVLQMTGARRGAKYVFTDSWTYHDHEVAGVD